MPKIKVKVVEEGRFGKKGAIFEMEDHQAHILAKTGVLQLLPAELPVKPAAVAQPVTLSASDKVSTKA